MRFNTITKITLVEAIQGRNSMNSHDQRRRVRLCALAGVAAASLLAHQATAAEVLAANKPDGASLQAQVRALTALVQNLAEKDQQQIQALTSEVAALQAKLDQQEGATAQAQASAQSAQAATQALAQKAQTRTAQNDRGGFDIQGAPVDADPARAVPRVTQNANHRFAFQSADGQYSIGLTGDIQFDTGAYVNFKPGSKVLGSQQLSDGVNARRARIGVTGTAFGDFGYALVWDGGNSQDTAAKGIETAQIIYSGLKGASFEIGYSNTYFTLDQSTGSNDTLFLERATPSNVATNFNTGDARANAGVRFFGDRYWFGGYLTGPASGDSHTLTGERFGAFQRAAVQVLKGPDYSLHLGIGVDELLRAPNAGNGTPDTLTLSDQPELRIDPTALITTGAIGTATNPVTGGYVLDFETAATWGPLFWQGEYYRYQVDRQGLANANFDGAYGEVSWTFTGEQHLYNTQAGSYFRIVPKHPFSLSHGGWGAWELAARASYIDLNSNFQSGTTLSGFPAAVDGGMQHSYSLGLNWYPNDLIRFLVDYNHLDYDKENGTAVKGAALGVPIGAKFDAISFRAQVAY